VRSIEVTEGTIDYDETGAGPPVVLLHGLLMDHTVWDAVLPLLPAGFRYIRPVLPLGSHRRAMSPGADLTLPGQVRLVAGVLDALSLRDVTLVHSDWGGALFLTARGLDHRLARQVILPCEAFGNFPPGLPGKMVAAAARLPGGLRLAARQLRVGWLRRLPPVYGQMARRPVPDDVIRRWTEPVLRDPGVRRDLLAYCRSTFDKAALTRDTEALRQFQGQALVLWSPDNKVMPPEHGHRLAELMPRARYAEIPGAYVLSMLDEPEAAARAIGDFLTGLGGLGGLGAGGRAGLRGNPGRRPAADDVPHGQQADDLLPLHDDEVPEAAANHRRRRALHRPLPRGEDDVLRAMIGGDLSVRAFPMGDGDKDVPFREDPDSRVVRVHDDRGPDRAGRHHPSRLT
jgi:pimeloyl-ACP methyl ester carboxylesterase